MKKLLFSLAIFILLVAYTLSDGSSYSGILVGVLLLPIFVITQLIVMKILFPHESKAKNIE